MFTREDLSLLLNDVIVEVAFELGQRQVNQPGPGSVGELEKILSELSEVNKILNSDELPPRKHRQLTSPRLVTDTWPAGSDLGERICMVARLYQELDPED